MMRFMLKCMLVSGIVLFCTWTTFAQEYPSNRHDLNFPALAGKWDEGVPVGNGDLGALIWKKGENIRFSLDRKDLWDLRPWDGFRDSCDNYAWICRQVESQNQAALQGRTRLYANSPGPTKIPGAALEIFVPGNPEVKNNRLVLRTAVSQVEWTNGMRMESFVHATRPVGWICIRNCPEGVRPELMTPNYQPAKNGKKQGLGILGYRQGEVITTGDKSKYHQQGWGDFFYDVAVAWRREGNDLYGVWSITSSLGKQKAEKEVDAALKRGMQEDYSEHCCFWEEYWNRSAVSLPDPVLEKQYYQEMYKFACVSRERSWPISLQSVWTADNGQLPPWRGDYHHDLNTQLSYWPCFIGNQLKEGSSFINTLWAQRESYKEYTRYFFGTEGMNMPGITSLTGAPMGGWLQYSYSATVSAWTAQYFYLHWKYTADRNFLKERAYPFLRDAALFLEQISYKKNGKRYLPLSASPEMYNNSLKAWLPEISNFDLSLMYFAFTAAEEMALELGLEKEAGRWAVCRSELPELAKDQYGGLVIAPGHPYTHSHRHFSHLLAIHPLGIIDWSKGEKDRNIIRASIAALDQHGPRAWVGYSYSWLGNLKARAMDGEGAAKALRIFAECFCLPNTFHVNGDQSRSGKSGFTYRPFTLEGNFAFASGIQEMLLQSHSGVIRVFPAIPVAWQEVSFRQLRAMGAFLVDAVRREGKTVRIEIVAEKGGKLCMANPFAGGYKVNGEVKKKIKQDGILEFQTKPGERIVLESL